jgi:hypothetical protein
MKTLMDEIYIYIYIYIYKVYIRYILIVQHNDYTTCKYISRLSIYTVGYDYLLNYVKYICT